MFTEIEGKSGRRRILVSYWLIKEAHKDKVIQSVIELSVHVFERFVNWLGYDLVKSFCVCLEKVFSDNMVQCPVARTHVSGALANSLS